MRFPLVATSSGGTTTFHYTVEHGHDYLGDFVSYRIFDSPVARTTSDPNEEWYEARFRFVGEDEIQPELLANNDDPRYTRKGITPAVFKQVVVDTGRRLVSGSNKKQHQRLSNEYRTSAVDSVWVKLVKSGCATYNPDEDRYTYTP